LLSCSPRDSICIIIKCNLEKSARSLSTLAFSLVFWLVESVHLAELTPYLGSINHFEYLPPRPIFCQQQPTADIMTPALELRRSLKALSALLSRKRDELDPTYQNNSLSTRLIEVFLRTWDLGLTAFGGPPVHFQIIYNRFVEGKGGSKWIDEQTVSCSQCSNNAND